MYIESWICMKCRIILGNENDKTKYEYVYKYIYNSKIKDINIIISEDYCIIEYDVIRVNTNSIKNITSPYFKSALKKVMLLYILKYEKKFNFNSISIKYNENSELFIINESIFFSLLTNDDFIGLYHADNEKFYIKLLNCKEDNILSSINAYLCGLNKKNETEKFIYLWMCLNGLYNYLREEKAQEIGGLCKLHILLNNNYSEKDYRVERKDRNIICQNIMKIINRFNIKTLEKDLLLKEKDIMKIIKNTCPNYKGDTFQFLSIYFSYYCRCNILHANKPINLFYFGELSEKQNKNNESLIQVKHLEIVNYLLLKLINKCLPLIIDNI